MTIIDLPGFIHFREDETADKGDVKKIIEEIYEKYMSEKNTTICLVMAATVEPQTCYTFTLAKKFDPLFIRTIFCITKVDLKDNDFDSILKVASNNNLKHYFFLRCRNKEDLDKGMTIEKAREKEKDILEKHRFLKNIDDSWKGISNLCKFLIKLQMDSIAPHFQNNAKIL